MKTIIDRKVYNTDTAEKLCHWDNGLGNGDFRNCSEDLYKTQKGAYFLCGEGGAMSKYSRKFGNMSGAGSGIIVLSDSEAMEWLEAHRQIELIERHFASEIEEA